jgi:MSHA biogenesis protein MshP
MERTLIPRNKQHGFALLASVFLIVVMGLAATFMVRFSSTVQTGQGQLILAQRAKQAAVTGIEYGIYTVAKDTCTPSTTLSMTEFSQFTVVVTCVANSYLEGKVLGAITLYTVTATANYGVVGSPDHVWRQFTVRLEQ